MLKHEKVYGDQVCLIGHSKGGDLAMAASLMLKKKATVNVLVKFRITQMLASQILLRVSNGLCEDRSV